MLSVVPPGLANHSLQRTLLKFGRLCEEPCETLQKQKVTWVRGFVGDCLWNLSVLAWMPQDLSSPKALHPVASRRLFHLFRGELMLVTQGSIAACCGLQQFPAVSPTRNLKQAAKQSVGNCCKPWEPLLAIPFCLTSVAPNAGQNKACRSAFPHFAMQAARGETRKMWISLPSHTKHRGLSKAAARKRRRNWKLENADARPRKMRLIGLAMAGLRCSPRLA